MDAKKIDEVATLFRNSKPDWWSALYPRFYNHPNGYMSPKFVSTFLMANTISFLGRKEHLADGVHVCHNTAAYLAAHRMPTYFVAPDLMDALIQSDLPDNLTWLDMPMPMPCATLMIPLGKINHANEGSIGFLSYARYWKDKIFYDRFWNSESVPKHDIFSVITSTHQTMIPPLYHMVLNEDISFVSQKKLHETSWPQQATGTWNIPTDQADKDLQERMIAIAFRIIMAMNAKPELVSRGERIGNKRMKHGEEIWTPNIIGRNYRYKRSNYNEGTGITPRTHWRRGHMRQQPYGPGSSLRKTIWIEPALINADTEE